MEVRFLVIIILTYQSLIKEDDAVNEILYGAKYIGAPLGMV